MNKLQNKIQSARKLAVEKQGEAFVSSAEKSFPENLTNAHRLKYYESLAEGVLVNGPVNGPEGEDLTQSLIEKLKICKDESSKKEVLLEILYKCRISKNNTLVDFLKSDKTYVKLLSEIKEENMPKVCV